MELLDDIKGAESEGEEIVAKARQESDEVIRSAHEEARRLTESVKEECRRLELQKIADAESEAREGAEAAGKKNQELIDSFRASARDSMERAVKLIIDSVAGNS